MAGDPSLSEAQRAARSAALEDQLPAPLKQARLAATEPARRLAELDRARAEWQRRLRDFEQRRAALKAAEPDQAARAERLERLLAEMFTPPERLRVLALSGK